MGDAFDEDDVVPIKQVWKWIFPKKMETAVGKRFVTGDSCQFYIELHVGKSHNSWRTAYFHMFYRIK